MEIESNTPEAKANPREKQEVSWMQAHEKKAWRWE